MRLRWAATLLVAALAPAAWAETPDTRAVLQEAVESYGAALDSPSRDARLAGFRRAEQLFARAAVDGTGNAELYANLGNAALQAEHLGPAVLAYRRALRVDPGNSRAEQNLAHARALLPQWVPRPEPTGLLDSFFFWHRALPRATRARVAAVCFCAAALLVAFSLRTGNTALRNLALLPLLGWGALAGSALLDPAARAVGEAVVVADEAVARAADSLLSPGAFPNPLPGGVELTIVEERSPWLRVRLANGRDAWLPESSVARVQEPASP